MQAPFRSHGHTMGMRRDKGGATRYIHQAAFQAPPGSALGHQRLNKELGYAGCERKTKSTEPFSSFFTSWWSFSLSRLQTRQFWEVQLSLGKPWGDLTLPIEPIGLSPAAPSCLYHWSIHFAPCFDHQGGGALLGGLIQSCMADPKHKPGGNIEAFPGDSHV